jgi:wyosine [tRNA(Phe)-imidazoG37] synthetase (radical SAM superfamily)
MPESVTAMPAYRHLFGPVPSRRFGRSLGVDLVRPKTCSLNCLFCQLGPTPATAVDRRADVPLEEVIAELDAWNRAGGQTDFVTLGGSGEPTLHPQFGELLRWIRDRLPFRSLLLSNGTLFTLEEVRAAATAADAVKVSLHAWDQASFERLVRPHPSLRLDAILEGYRRFRSLYRGRLHLEVFVVPGRNDRPEQMARIARLAASFRPDAVQLNTLARPPAEASVTSCPPAVLAALAPLFTPAAEIPNANGAAAGRPALDGELPDADAVVALVRRHPASAEQLAALGGRTVEATLATLKGLAAQQRVRLVRRDDAWFAAPP